MIKKNKIIESYIFSNQLSMLCNTLKTSQFKDDLLLKTANNLCLNLSAKIKNILLKTKINKLTLNVLNLDISKTKFFKNSTENYKLLCKMMNEFINHFNIITNYTSS